MMVSTDQPPTTTTPLPVVKKHTIDDEFLINLKTFYSKLFPFKEFHAWLSYDNVQKNYFQNREFSFTLANDAYLRYNSFANEKELKDALVKLNPVKIDIGAVYNVKPKDRKMFKDAAFQPQERELVFDIDMTDYDDVRTCCQKANICLKCWDFMTISIKIIDKALRDDFNFKHLLWVYSGRRGVHCWVSDKSARQLSGESRRAVVSYLEVIKGGQGVSRKVNIPMKGPVHPSLTRAQVVLDGYFEKTLLKAQNILGTKENWDKVLALIPDAEIRINLDTYFTKNAQMTSIEKWKVICDELRSPKKRLGYVVKDILFQYSYPRLDTHVSTGMNHLLKSPFCVHPGTGKVCVPIDPLKCEQFDPMTVPTLDQLVLELNSITDSTDKDYEKTSLMPSLAIYEKFLAGLKEESRVALRAQNQENDKKMMF